MNKIRENLWIGDIQDAREGETSRFSVVVTICQDNVSDNLEEDIEYFHYPLSDGPAPRDAYNPGKFEYELFKDAVETIVEGMENEETIFCHCHAGSSRSVMACVSALCDFEGLGYEDAYKEVRAKRGGICPSPEVVEFARRYVQQ